MKAMQLTMEYLCKHIQGCVFGYTQSDEITLILIDYQKLNSDAWFGYEVQKICSISASMATMAFNRYFRDLIEDSCMTEPRHLLKLETYISMLANMEQCLMLVASISQRKKSAI